MSVRLLTVPIVVAVLAGGFYVISRAAPTGGLVAIGAGVAWVVVAAAASAWLCRRDRTALKLVLGAAIATALVGGFLIRPQGNEVSEQIVTGEPATAAKPAPAAKSPTAAKRGTPAKPGKPPKPLPAAKPAKGAEPMKAPKPAAAAAKPATETRPRTAAEARENAERPAPQGNVQILSGGFSGESGHSGRGKAAVVELADGRRKLTFSEFDVDPGAGGGLRVYLAAGRPTSDGEVSDFIDLAALKGTKGDQQYDIPREVNLRRYSTVVVWCVPFTTRIAQAPLR